MSSETKPAEAKVDNVTAVMKVMAVLEGLDIDHESSLAELSQRAMMSKSTAYRFLQTLKNLGYVAQDSESEKYRLTMKAFVLGSSALGNMDLIKMADPDMAALSQLTREAVHLGTLDASTGEIVYVHKYNSHFNLCMNTRIGDRCPAHTTAMGKALMSCMSDAQLEHLLTLQPLEPRTERTLTSRQALDEQLAQARQSGLAEDLEEMDAGVCCFATPILDHTGKAIAALSMSIPTIRYHQDVTLEYKKILCESGRNISANLGWKPSHEHAHG
ncbi:DNA-binding transcriptional regulator KdgR [Cobetia sp. 1CM21F]|uniref:DNA-binding transcriptional regulator KdgR n=1 Tax=Cobetia sp. 1CM21F TaxID=2929163 RepID=UPI0020C0DAE2|nr:DNA-binding transcriptional regulator KdgR [Cobetia sp. 1CM21F]MCK8067051.1 DNA-binding transcriptional regulator KdgR [Cobetia sp. 1CM21F]